MTKEQIITDQYAIYNSDNMFVMNTMPDESIDLSVYSPPFMGLYNYSSSPNDHSNCESKEQFFETYNFVVKEISRLTKPGRISAVHVCEVVQNDSSSFDLPHEVIRLHEQNGFQYKGRITVWKEPLKVRMRTMVKSLMHKLIVEDATECFVAHPDYVLIFKKKGINKVPVTHPFGLIGEYAGETPFLPAHIETYGDYYSFRKKWLAFKGDVSENKLSHLTWQRYASSVWDDIRIDNVLPFKDSRDDDDEKHVHALQLDVIDRIVELYSNPSEVVFTPYMGVGSEVYSPVSYGRKAIGVELKGSYFKQSVLNLKEANKRFKKLVSEELFA